MAAGIQDGVGEQSGAGDQPGGPEAARPVHHQHRRRDRPGSALQLQPEGQRVGKSGGAGRALPAPGPGRAGPGGGGGAAPGRAFAAAGRGGAGAPVARTLAPAAAWPGTSAGAPVGGCSRPRGSLGFGCLPPGKVSAPEGAWAGGERRLCLRGGGGHGVVRLLGVAVPGAAVGLEVSLALGGRCWVDFLKFLLFFFFNGKLLLMPVEQSPNSGRMGFEMC